MRLSPQHNEHCAVLLEVHAISRAVIDPHLAHARTHRLDIAGVADAQAVNAHLNPRTRLAITKAAEPLAECRGLDDFKHDVL